MDLRIHCCHCADRYVHREHLIRGSAQRCSTGHFTTTTAAHREIIVIIIAVITSRRRGGASGRGERGKEACVRNCWRACSRHGHGEYIFNLNYYLNAPGGQKEGNSARTPVQVVASFILFLPPAMRKVASELGRNRSSSVTTR